MQVVLGPQNHSCEGFRLGRAGPALQCLPPLNFTAASHPPHLLPPSTAENHLRKEWEEGTALNEASVKSTREFQAQRDLIYFSDL